MLSDPPGLVGRAPELATTRRLLATTTSARRLRIGGAPGIGKSRLLATIADAARGAGRAVLTATAVPDDALHPLAVLERALGDTSEGADATPTPTASVIGGHIAERKVRAEAHVAELVDRAASAGPLLLAIDDVDLADDSTRRLVDRLVEVLADRPLLVATTQTTPLPGGPPDDRVIDLMLSPLTSDDVDAIVAANVGRPITAPLTRAAIDTAAGNPLLVLAVLAELTSDVPPADPHAALGRAVERLPEPTVDLLRTIAILGRSVSLDELLALRDDDPLAVHGALTVAADAGVLHLDDARATIRHALVTDALTESVPLPVRRAIHGRFADVLAARRAPAARVAHHALLADDPTRREASAWLLAGAREIGSRAPALALELLEQALAAAEPDDPRRVEILTETVTALGWAGELDRCEATARVVLAQPIDEPTRGAMRRALALCAFLQNRAPDAAAECEASAAESTDAAARARALGEAALARMAAGDLAAAGQRALDAVDAGYATGETISRCVGWSVQSRLCAFELQLETSLDVAERAIDVARDDASGEAGLYHPGFFRLLTLVDLDRLDDAAAELEREWSIGDRAGLAWTRPIHHGLAAVVHLFAGRLDVADAAVADGIRQVDAVGSELASVWLRAAGALVALHRGRTFGARRLVDEAHEVLARQVPLLGVDLLALAETRLAAAEGDRHAAVDVGCGALELFESMGMSTCTRIIAPDVVRLAAVTDRRPALLDAHRILHGVADRTGLPLDVAHATLADALVGEGQSAAVAARSAVATIDQSPRTLDGALVRQVAAQVVWADGDRDGAAELLHDALALATAAGSTALAADVRQQFTALGLRRPRRRSGDASGLTTRERAVAELVAFGRTNAEVAEHLEISVRTVETHLTRIYAKLGLRSRTELAAEIHRTRPA